MPPRRSLPLPAACRALVGGLVAAALLGLLVPGGEGSELRRTAIVRAIERARPAVVNIHGEKTLRPVDGRLGEIEGMRRVNGMGTGVIVDERGYIITNHHVVEGVQKIQVTLADRSSHVARLVEHDSATDLAIIKIDAPQPLPVIPVGTSSDLMTGEPVIAVGNAYGYEHTVTRGIISALHRSVQVTDAQSYDDLIQTDASINPGNSGGPLLNIDGELIGINVAVRAGAQGIGFAIPVDKAMAVAAELLSTRRIDQTWHGIVGRSTVSDEGASLIVESLTEESPARHCDLQPGDVIERVNNRPVERALDLERALLGREAGERVPLVVRRDDREINLEIALARLPEAQKSAPDPTWELLGLKLEPVPPRLFQQFQTRYRGGLSVKAVRSNSPADQQGIRPGDVLVGMHVWETISQENVSYILNRRDVAELGPLKFYILRGGETLYGHLQVSMQATDRR